MTKTFVRLPSIVAGFILVAVGAAQAASLHVARDSVRTAARAAFVVERELTLAPLGQVRLCMKEPAACAPDPGGAPVLPGTTEVIRALSAVNAVVNETIESGDDNETTGQADSWTVSPAAGDCEDFALTKRAALIALGLPAAALRIAVARTASGEGHAVLIARTAKGDLVLDNRTNLIRPWNSTDLQIIAIQSGRDPRHWFKV